MVVEMLGNLAPAWVSGLLAIYGLLHYWGMIQLIPVDQQKGGVLALVGILLFGASAGWITGAVDSDTDKQKQGQFEYKISTTAGNGFQLFADQDMLRTDQVLNTTDGSLKYATATANFTVTRIDDSTEESVFHVKAGDNPEVTNESTDKSYNVIAERSDGTIDVRIKNPSDGSVQYGQRAFSMKSSGSSQVVEVTVKYNPTAVDKAFELYDTAAMDLTVAGKQFTIKEMLTSTTS